MPRFLTDRDVELIEGLLREARQRRHNPAQRPYYPENDHQAPETYIAYTPNGISSPDADHATGTGTESSYMDLAYDTCRIFKTVDKAGDLTDVDVVPAGFNKIVYNLGSAAITAGTFFLAARDKFGAWIAIPTATSGGGSSSSAGMTLISEITTTVGFTGATSYSGTAGTLSIPADGSSPGSPVKYLITGKADAAYTVTVGIPGNTASIKSVVSFTGAHDVPTTSSSQQFDNPALMADPPDCFPIYGLIHNTNGAYDITANYAVTTSATISNLSGSLYITMSMWKITP